MRAWLIVIGGLVFLGMILDLVRRARNTRRDSFNMDLRMQHGMREEDPLEVLKAELPNGGARKVQGAVKAPDPRPEKSAAFLAKAAANNPGAINKSAASAKVKVEPKFSTSASLEDTQKIRRTPTMSVDTAKPSVNTNTNTAGVDLEQSVPMLMDADDRAEATFNDGRDPLMSGAAPVLSKPRVVPRQTLADALSTEEEQEVIVINVMSRQPEGFVGASLLENVLASGMRFGDMSIFHHYAAAPDDDSILYSMANIVKPGTFSLNSMQSFQTPGVSLFMTLPLKSSQHISAMDVFDKMLVTAKRLAQNLNGELKDERRSVMTGQTIEHCRQRISEFSRKKLSRSGKFTADT